MITIGDNDASACPAGNADVNAEVTVNMGGTDTAYAMAIDADGNIVLAGTTGSLFAMARFTPAGTLDTTFNSTGTKTLSIPNYSSLSLRAVKIQTDGKIDVGGFATSASKGKDFGIARLTSAGALDTTFNSTGYVTTDYGVVVCCGVNGDDGDFSRGDDNLYSFEK